MADKFTHPVDHLTAIPIGSDALHDAYVEAVNAAVETGRDGTVPELVATYLDERRTVAIDPDQPLAA